MESSLAHGVCQSAAAETRGANLSQPLKCSQIEQSSKYVNDLENVALFVIEETVMDDFKDASTGSIEYKMILNSLLMPFFQMRLRILEKHQFFSIGEI